MPEKDEGLLLTHEQQRLIQYECFKRHGEKLDAIGQTPVYEIYDEICKAQLAHATPILVKQERERITNELDACFKLAPNDNEYLKMLIEDTLAYIKTGLRRKERQALKEE